MHKDSSLFFFLYCSNNEKLHFMLCLLQRLNKTCYLMLYLITYANTRNIVFFIVIVIEYFLFLFSHKYISNSEMTTRSFISDVCSIWISFTSVFSLIFMFCLVSPYFQHWNNIMNLMKQFNDTYIKCHKWDSMPST